MVCLRESAHEVQGNSEVEMEKDVDDLMGLSPDPTINNVAAVSNTDLKSSVPGSCDFDKSGEVAIKVTNAFKSYGRGESRKTVLSNLNMTVQKNVIYGLLGPSGCGKTTLLSSIVGVIKLESGGVQVFGQNPGSSGIAIPGPMVGLMPQELCLYEYMTLGETLMYYGTIACMSKEKIKERIEFLIDLLDLPRDGDRLIKNMSGGQQRRISMGAALIHEPPLLLLDEPTVGVDPLLRTYIWKHLVDLATSAHTTIVITTHYIEEAGRANVVGMMRRGKLLTEDSPTNLLTAYGSTSLEKVFLRLCVGDMSDDSLNGEEPKFVEANRKSDSETTKDVVMGCMGRGETCFSIKRLRNEVHKNFLKIYRNIGGLLFQIILPILQVILFCYAIGRDPVELKMIVFNEESSCVSWASGCVFPNPGSSHPNLSCIFFDKLDKVTIKQVPSSCTGGFECLQQQIQRVERGDAWGVIHVQNNFSQALLGRIGKTESISTSPPSERVLNQSTIHIYMDQTNQQIHITIKKEINDALQDMFNQTLSACDINPKVTSIPLKYEKPVFGGDQTTFTDFMAPGIILAIIYFMSVGLTSSAFIIERRDGLMRRSWVAGVTAVEVLMGHMLTQFFVTLSQTVVTLVSMIYIFEVNSKGNGGWIGTLTVMQGICGMAMGLVMSAGCNTEQEAVQASLGTFFPFMLLSGTLWPLEGMPKYLQYVSYCLPQTLACEAMRGLMERGWNIDNFNVYMGFVVTGLWTFVLLSVGTILVKLRR